MDIKIELLFNGQWYPVDIENLRKDNIIRVYKDGELVKDTYGFTERKCLADVVYDEKLENWKIQSIGVKLDENNNVIDNVIKINK